jgi:hypothetical protein
MELIVRVFASGKTLVELKDALAEVIRMVLVQSGE